MKFRPGIVSSPGTSVANKTGTWRIRRPVYVQKNCIGCGMCKLVCPEAAVFEEGEKRFNVNLIYCKGCGLCANVCPKRDILMEKEEK